MMRQSLTPMARADRMNSRSRSVSTEPRTRRAYCTHCETISRMIVLVSPPPTMAMKVMASRMKGIASCTSANRMTSMSQKPR